MMNFRKYLPLCVLAAGALLATAQTSWRNGEMSPRQKLSAVEAAIANYYVDTVDEDKLVEDAIRGMLENLDPHSSYSNREETKELTEPLDGNFSGIGIQFNMQKDTLYVIQTIAGGPSERVGILPGDRFVEVNDTVIAGVKMKNRDIMKRLRGPKGTVVNIKVKRRNVPELLEFRVTRDDIPVYSIDAAYMADDKTGYIRLSRFARSSFQEYKDAVKKLKKQGMEQLILDLTDNGGGYLDIAAQLANEFLNRDELIVYTEGRRRPRTDINALGNGDFRKGKVVFMVNQLSASASEILSGAIQDWDRGVVVGRRTFGKGLVQQPLDLPDGTMVRLTIARYYTPSGRCIQKPYKPGDREDYEMDIVDRYKHGEFSNADSIQFADSLKCYTLKNRRAVYGGGGIMPDVFVPLDTTEYSDYYRDLVAKGVLNQFVLQYVDSTRKELKVQYPSVDKFETDFVVGDDLLKQLTEAGERDSVKFNEEQFNVSREMLRTVVKALVARDIYDMEAYFRIVNRRNNIFTEALRVINDDKLYKSLLSGEKK